MAAVRVCLDRFPSCGYGSPGLLSAIYFGLGSEVWR
jgi:hypothetical protein